MRLRPRSLPGQLALLIMAAFVAAHLISLWLLADDRGVAIRAAQRQETIERAAAVARALHALPPDSQASILAAVNARLVRFSIDDAPLVGAAPGPAPGLGGGQGAGLGAGMADAPPMRMAEIAISPHDGQPAHPPAALAWLAARARASGLAPVEFRLSVPLADGGWLNARARFSRPALPAPRVALGMALSLALILAALWVGLRRITHPLGRLAAAADGFGLDTPAPPMPRGGPREVRALSDALGRMHDRLGAMMADRTRMLAALGHDLRSPLTALRLRAEMVDDDETRERMIATLDEMTEMVDATLAYARGVSTDQPMEPADLAALLRDLADTLGETGPPVTVLAPAPVTAPVRRMAIRRALRNLIENAQRYGGGARIGVQPDGTGACAVITIDDDGPGIPNHALAHVFDPFTRLEQSRSRETGGIGLGLPIARAILRAHGGDVTLANRPGGGLRATARLPRTPPAQDPDPH